jgi:hypothetical protein
VVHRTLRYDLVLDGRSSRNARRECNEITFVVPSVVGSIDKNAENFVLPLPAQSLENIFSTDIVEMSPSRTPIVGYLPPIFPLSPSQLSFLSLKLKM